MGFFARLSDVFNPNFLPMMRSREFFNYPLNFCKVFRKGGIKIPIQDIVEIRSPLFHSSE